MTDTKTLKPAPKAGEAFDRVHISDTEMVHEIVQDVEPHLDYCHNMRAIGATGDSDFKYAGRLPDVVIETYCRINGITYKEVIQNPVHVRTMMNDPALKKLRVWEGRL